MPNLEWRKGVAMEVDLQHVSVQLNTTPTLSSLVFRAFFFFLSFSDQFSKLFFFFFQGTKGDPGLPGPDGLAGKPGIDVSPNPSSLLASSTA